MQRFAAGERGCDRCLTTASGILQRAARLLTVKIRRFARAHDLAERAVVGEPAPGIEPQSFDVGLDRVQRQARDDKRGRATLARRARRQAPSRAQRLERMGLRDAVYARVQNLTAWRQ